jgi:hypothetical protein
VIHVLLAETEQRLVATFERYVDNLVALRGGVDALLAMADRAALLTLDQTSEVPPAARARVPSSSPRRFAHWRHAVTRMLQASGRPVPWPLADPEAGTHRGPQRAAMAVSNDPGTSPEPLPIESGSRPTEQDDPRYPKVATPPGRPTHARRGRHARDRPPPRIFGCSAPTRRVDDSEVSGPRRGPSRTTAV